MALSLASESSSQIALTYDLTLDQEAVYGYDIELCNVQDNIALRSYTWPRETRAYYLMIRHGSTSLEAA